MELYDFIHHVFGIHGSCPGFCEICNAQHPACGGSQYIDGKCPDECNGPDEFDNLPEIAWDWNDRQVGACCFEKIFGPLKAVLDSRRRFIISYFSSVIKEEKASLSKQGFTWDGGSSDEC